MTKPIYVWNKKAKLIHKFVNVKYDDVYHMIVNHFDLSEGLSFGYKSEYNRAIEKYTGIKML